jgi:glyoxylase-like metal-dependent hydrolase (beta-lactamase superfamily II)
VDTISELGLKYTSFQWHSQSDIVFLHDDLAVSGDIMLQNIFTTPIMDIDANNLQKRFVNYEYFCKSFEKLIDLENYTFLPGHRENITDPKQWISFYVSKVLQRIIRILPKLRKESIAEAVREIVPDMESRPPEAFIKLSEVLFFKDVLNNPELLKNSLKNIDMYDIFSDQFDLLEPF